AQSEGPGKGSAFVVELPLLSSAAPPEALEPSPSPRPDGAARRVLIVDDNLDCAEMLELGLQALGHETRVAHDGPRALAAARDFHPDVALLDIGLPGMDGFELARRLRDELGTKTPTLVAVTGYGQASDHARTREAGFAHHLVKPVELDTVGTILA